MAVAATAGDEIEFAGRNREAGSPAKTIGANGRSPATAETAAGEWGAPADRPEARTTTRRLRERSEDRGARGVFRWGIVVIKSNERTMNDNRISSICLKTYRYRPELYLR
jgi:hypothetical protein